jgi:hypothetical protein
MRRRKLLTVLVVVLALAGAAAFVLWPWRSRILLENFDRVKAGMSRAEVEAILGPPGDHRTGPTNLMNLGSITMFDTIHVNRAEKVRLGGSGLALLPSPPGSAKPVGEGDQASLWVTFDGSGKVVAAEFSPALPQQQSPLANLLWRAKRQWRR